jgi:hypothetical protein
MNQKSLDMNKPRIKWIPLKLSDNDKRYLDAVKKAEEYFKRITFLK